MKRSFFLLLALGLAGGACSPGSPATVPTATPATATLTVFAAASLTDAFGELGKDFQTAHPGLAINFNFGGSQTLRTQLEQGASADVFASANQKEMDTLVGDKLVAVGTPRVFLTNQLVVILPPGNPAKLTSLSQLSRKGLKLVLAAREVPAGNYALQVLDNLEKEQGNGFETGALANVVSYETDVKQVVAKVQLGEADAGIVYVSDAVAAPQLRKLEIPAASNVIAKYPIAALSESRNPALAQAFIDYVLSPAGQSVLQKWGFQPAG